MGLPGKYLSTNLEQERKENFIGSHVASLCPWSLYIYHWTAVVTIMCSISLQSMCTMPGCCLLFCRPYDVVIPWCSMAGTLPSFCVHHISAHIQAIFQNKKLDKILFLSVFLLFSLLRSVKHPGLPYQDHLCQRRNLPPFRPQKPSPCLQHPFLSFYSKP